MPSSWATRTCSKPRLEPCHLQPLFQGTATPATALVESLLGSLARARLLWPLWFLEAERRPTLRLVRVGPGATKRQSRCRMTTAIARLRTAYEVWLGKTPEPSSDVSWRAFLTGYSFAKVEAVDGFEIALQALQSDYFGKLS